MSQGRSQPQTSGKQPLPVWALLVLEDFLLEAAALVLHFGDFQS